jgi:hypothetical protein
VIAPDARAGHNTGVINASTAPTIAEQPWLGVVIGLIGMAVTAFVFVRLRRAPNRTRGQLAGAAVVFAGMLAAFVLGVYHLMR